jgi:hypothetical protein
MSERLPLSAVVITLNAASQLEACLRSLQFCADIVVVDSGSIDDTRDIARRHGARVIDCPWRGFGPQKQFAVAQAVHDWVLCVDADERVSPELQVSIAKAISAPQFGAYRFPRCNRFMGRYLRHGEGYPDLSLRLFDRRQAHWSDDRVHEKVMTETAIGSLRGDLMHDSAESIENYLDKQNRYTSLAAEAAYAQGKRASGAQIVLSPLFRFIKFYIFRLGFLDGLPGLIHILIGCGNSFSKYAKMVALQSKTQDSQ